MANEHTYSDAADLRVAQILNREVLTLLADMTDLRSVCRFVPHPLSGSQVIKTPQVQLAYTMAAPGEDTAPSNSAFVDSSFTLTPVPEVRGNRPRADHPSRRRPGRGRHGPHRGRCLPAGLR